MTSALTAAGWAPGAGTLPTTAPDADGDSGDDPVVSGDGGAVMWSDDDRVHLGLVGADGGASEVGAISGPEFLLGGVAVDNGTVAGVGSDIDGRLVLLRGAPGGGLSASRPISGGPLVGTTAVARRPGGGFNVVWDEETDAGVSTSVKTLVVRPDGSTTTPASLADLTKPDGRADRVDDIAVSPESNVPTVAWAETHRDRNDEVDSSALWTARGGSGTHQLAKLDGDLTPDDVELRLDPSGRGVATWSVSDAAEGVTRSVASIAPDNSVTCTVPVSYTVATLVVRAGVPVMASASPTGVLSTRAIGAACDETDVSDGPSIPAPDDIAATTDAEGTVVVTASDATGAITAADDRTAPTVGAFSAPGSITAGSDLSVSARAADAWGSPTIRWDVDGSGAVDTPDAVFRGLAAGAHVLNLTVSDGLGNGRTDPHPFSVAAAGGPDPTPTPDPTPVTPPAPVAPPVDVVVPPDPPSAKHPKGRPSVRLGSVAQTRTGWRLRASIRNVGLVRVGLYRERYLRRSELAGRRRARTCPRPTSPTTHPESGLRATMTLRVGGRIITVRLSAGMRKALRKRGRYSIVVTGWAGNTPHGAFSQAHRRFTVC